MLVLLESLSLELSDPETLFSEVLFSEFSFPEFVPAASLFSELVLLEPLFSEPCFYLSFYVPVVSLSESRALSRAVSMASRITIEVY